MRGKAVVLLSGGLDSATVLAGAVADGLRAHALTVLYGQRHSKEASAAKRLAAHFRVEEHRVVRISPPLPGSALTDRTIPVPQGAIRNPKSKIQNPIIPPTYVPARNTLLLALALGYAEAVGAGTIYYGANAVDFSGYPDCRPEFVAAFQRVAEAGTKAGASGKAPRIAAPLIGMTKAEIVRRGAALGVPFHLTWSCYLGGRRPCGECDSCLLRAKGFAEAGIRDPLISEIGRGGTG